ncbi:hypothetical protein pb186bvf_014563 [Paramecium bursaria]
MEEIIPFLVIKDQKSQTRITLAFKAYRKQIDISVIEQNITNIFTISNYSQQWSYIYLYKQEQFEYSTFEQQIIQFSKNQNYILQSHYGIMITWQNITFSLKAFKQEIGQLSDLIMIKNNYLFQQQKLVILNYRNLIEIQFYFRQTKLTQKGLLFIVSDELQTAEFIVINNTLKIIIDTLNYYKYEVPDIVFQWNFISVQFDNYDTIFTILTQNQSQIFTHNVKSNIDLNFLFGLEIQFLIGEIQIENIMISNDYKQIPTNTCYPNCQECDKNICLRCLNNLSLDNYCECQENQYFDDILQLCQDMSKNQIFQTDFQYQKDFNCQFGYYYNIYSKKCLSCPIIQQYYCLDCFYQTELWSQNYTCIFQEIQTINFIELYNQQAIIYHDIARLIIFNHQYSEITNNRFLEFDYNNGQIYQIHQDVYNILNIICQSGYYISKISNKCVQLTRGTLSKSQSLTQCKLKYTKILNICMKCPKLCKICDFNYKEKTIICIIPEKGYYLSGYQAKTCPLECPFCFNSTYCPDITDEQSINDNQIMTNNCLIQQDQICLFCKDQYFLDFFNNCVDKLKVFGFYKFYFVIRQNDFDLNQQQIKNLILSKKLMSSSILLQTKVFRAQFQSLSYFVEQIECLQNQAQNCEINNTVKENYQFVSTLNNTYYCPNNNCYQNLILNVTVYISNRQLIIYENKNFYNFHDLFNGILKQQIYLQWIKINADVYVFETINQECQNFNLFLLNFPKLQQYLEYTNFSITLNFQQYSIFPDCYKQLIINFDHIEINYLITSSPIIIKIQSQFLKFYKCNFEKQNQIIFIISKDIVFLNTTFMNKFLDEPMIQFQIYTEINYLHFINCNFADIELQNSNLIEFEASIDNLLFQTTYIHDVFLQKSKFIKLKQVRQNILVKDMNITLLGMKSSFFFSNPAINKIKILYQFISIDDSLFQNSTFILQDQYAVIQNLLVKETDIIDSFFILIRFDCELTNIYFQTINSEFSNLVTLMGENLIQLYEILFTECIFNDTTSLITTSAGKIELKKIYLEKCYYFPNFKLITINAFAAQLDDIQISYLQVSGQQNVLSSLYFILISGQNIIIQNLTIQKTLIGQIKILHIVYSFLYFQNFKLSSISYFQQLQGDLITFSQKNNDSICLLNLFTINNITFKFNQQSLLFLFKGKQGQSYCDNFQFYNISSFYPFYLFSVTTQFIDLKNINLIKIDQIGFLQQTSSATQITNLNYQSILTAVDRNYDFYIFYNLACVEKISFVKILHSTFMNLRQPLIQSKNSGILQITLINITLVDYYYKNSIIKIDKSYFPQSRIQLEYIQIKNLNSQAFLIQSDITYLIIINNLYLFNSQIGLLQAYFIQSVVLRNIIQMNSLKQSQTFADLSDVRNHSVISNILFINVTQNNIFQVYNLQKLSTLINNIYLQETRSQNFIIINGTNIGQFILRDVVIQNSSINNFLINLFQKTGLIHRISNIYIQDTQILLLFDFKNQQLFVHKLQLINIQFQQSQFNNLTIYEDSYSYNCKYQEQQVSIKNKRLSVLNNFIDQYSPIFLSFHYKKKFQQILIHSNILQVQFNNNSIVYLPTGIPFNEYIKFNFLTQQQDQIYDYFAIVSNQAEDLSCNLKSSIDEQIGNYTNINQFILKNQVNIIDNFTFYLNPYQKYTHIQNDMICENFEYILRFNVRILPCQLGEFFNQNQCKICDVSKLQYSVSKIAYFCNIIDINKIEQAKRGQIKLKAGYWRPQIDNNIIEHCKQDLCQGGWQVGDQSCLQGQVGALCKECDIYNTRGSGQYAQNEISCLLCDYSVQLLFKGLLVISWLMFLVYLSYDTNKQVIRQYLSFKISQRKLADILMRQSLNQISVIIKICTNYAFYLYLIKDNLDFLYYQVSFSLNILSNPTELISPQLDCLLAQYNPLQLPYANLVFTLITPFFTMSLFYLIYLIILYFKLAQFQFNVILITIYSVYLFNQQLILQSQIKLLSSIKISNIEWVFLNLSYKYNTKEHYYMIFHFILPTTIIFIFTPVIIYFQIQNKDKRSISVIKYYGTLYREYKSSTYYWEIIRIYQKFLTIIQLYLYNQQNQVYYIFLVQIYLIIMIYAQPYPLKNLNQLEQKSLVSLNWCLMITFFMQDASNYLRATIFTIINIFLIIDIINNFVRKIQLQYRDQLNQINSIIVQKIPQTSKFINLQKSITVQENIKKVRNQVIQIKSKMGSTRSIYINNEIILSTNLAENLKSEIEMVNIKKQE